mgnify:CR=1 FL=1
MTDLQKFWLSNNDYLEYIWRSGNGSNEAVYHYTVMEIAANLHEIAKQLAEMNGYAPQENGK